MALSSWAIFSYHVGSIHGLVLLDHIFIPCGIYPWLGPPGPYFHTMQGLSTVWSSWAIFSYHAGSIHGLVFLGHIFIPCGVYPWFGLPGPYFHTMRVYPWLGPPEPYFHTMWGLPMVFGNIFVRQKLFIGSRSYFHTRWSQS